MSQEKIFADGFSFRRNENAPDFVVGRVSIKVEDAIAFMRNNQKNGWVNISIKYGRTGNPYCELDNFEAKGMSKNEVDMLKNEPNMLKLEENMSKNEAQNDPFFDDDVPF